MSISRLSISAIAFALTVAASAVHACGESLFRVGKGVSYREYTAPLPGSIIVVANTPGELLMVERLAAAGHHVTVVSGPEQVSESLAEQPADIVLALFSQRQVVESEINRYSVDYLPVALEGSEEELQARSAYDYSLSTDDSLKKFLKTIHKTLKQRQA